MYTSIKSIKAYILAAGVVVACGIAPASWATASFDVSAQATLTLTGITDSAGNSVPSTDVSVDIFSLDVDSLDSFLAGNAAVIDESASADTTPISGAVSLGVGDAVAQSASLAAEAVNGGAVAEQIALTTGLIDIENNVDPGRTVTFTLDWSLSLLAGVDDVLDEYAEAFASVALEVINLDTGALIDEFFHEVLITSDDPAFSDSGSDSISINIIGQGNANDYFPIGMDLYVDADGFAVSDAAEQVPEPGALILMAFGLAGIGYRRHLSKKVI